MNRAIPPPVVEQHIGFIGWLVLFSCGATMYCLAALIFLGMTLAGIGILFGMFDLIVFTGWFIIDIHYRQKELDKIEANKSWIEKVLEKRI
jgi:hypothetical protein